MNTDHSMKLDIYINYPGLCEEAFRFYEQHLGGKINMMMPHQQPHPNFPKEWKKPILHAIIEIGGAIVSRYRLFKTFKLHHHQPPVEARFTRLDFGRPY